jgi:hypothetical protein
MGAPPFLSYPLNPVFIFYKKEGFRLSSLLIRALAPPAKGDERKRPAG